MTYFPHGGLIAQLIVFNDGAESECGVVGREGMIDGLDPGGVPSLKRNICLVGTRASAIDSFKLEAARHGSPSIFHAIDRYQAWRAGCMTLSVACNMRHSVERRLARWMLTCADSLQQREIKLPQDEFAKLLGVQRSSVNFALQRFRNEGLVELGRGRVTMLDRAGILQHACECYGAMRLAQAEALIATAPPRHAVHTWT